MLTVVAGSAAAGAIVGAVIPPEVEGTGGSPGVGPVSYTHLTLPTLLLV